MSASLRLRPNLRTAAIFATIAVLPRLIRRLRGSFAWIEVDELKFLALCPLTVGHLLAMLVVILPFALLVALVEWQQQIQIGASLLVIGFGVFRFLNRRHPRVLARIRPTQLGLWSFAVAIAHGAGLMLVPIYLGLCRTADLDKGNEAAGALINANLSMAVLVSVVHSVAMIAAGGFLACLVYRYLGLKFVSRSWFNLDATWAFSLVLVGALSLAISLASRH
jgi:hypothetical protein